MNHEILFTGKRLDTGQWVHGSLVQMLVDGRIASCIATIKEAGRTNNDVPPMGILFTLNKDIFLVDPDTVGPYAGPIGKIPAEQRQSEELEEAFDEVLPSPNWYISNDGEDAYNVKQMEEMFCAGADWQKEQMMKSAFDGEITKFFDGGLSVKAQLPKGSKCCFGDKVKVIIIKEEKK